MGERGTMVAEASLIVLTCPGWDVRRNGNDSSESGICPFARDELVGEEEGWR